MLGKRNSKLMYFLWHLTSIVSNLVFNQFRGIFTNSGNKKLWANILFYFYFYLPLAHNLFQRQRKFLRVRLIRKKLPNFNFSFKKLINTRKEMYVPYVLFHLDVFNFLLTFCTRNYVHCDEKSVTFRLIFKYFSTLRFSLKKLKNIANFPFFNTK